VKELCFETPHGRIIRPVIGRILLGGFTGRSASDVAEHVAAMQALGVAPPAATPAFYSAMTCLLTQEEAIEVVGAGTRPEVEFVLFSWQGRRYVTVGKDQFDLETEKRLSTEKAKNLCQKVVGRLAWPLDEVAAHWDSLRLELSQGEIILQSGSVAGILSPEALLAAAPAPLERDAQTALVFSGTIPFRQGMEPGFGPFSMSLTDPVLGRGISQLFRVQIVHAPPISCAPCPSDKPHFSARRAY
jgi:hypothetical protein